MPPEPTTGKDVGGRLSTSAPTKRVVILRGGHFDGQPCEVDPTRLRIVLPYDRGVGEWEFDDRVEPTNLVAWVAYDRVDDETFQVAA